MAHPSRRLRLGVKFMDFLFHLDLPAFVSAIGYAGILAIVFAESGLFFGFFLPGDSLLFTAGLLASQGFFNIWLLIGLVILCAIGGAVVGYAFGNKVGARLFSREDSFWFHKRHVQRAEAFYEKHGKQTIILARFIPVVRTFAPIVAGIGKMEYKTFFTYNVIGAILWGTGLTLAGYFLGQVVPNAADYLFGIVVAIIFVSFLPVVIPYVRNKLKHE